MATFRTVRQRLGLLGLAALLLPPTLATAAEPITGKVVSIADGDTLTVLVDRQQIKVRLDGIDCPESGQAYGQKAKQATSQLAFGNTVTIRPTGTDKYSRMLANVLLPDGTSLNQELVRQGYAWWFRKYSKDQTLAKLEAEARQNKCGLWADANPVPPWDWRDQRRDGESKTPASTPAGTGYWLNTSSGVRHNSGCENYGKTKRGRPCGPNEGKACGICGG
jgi:endonuclease YncB( thermonuclease family)